MGQKNPFWESISRQTNLSDEVFPGQSLVEIIGDQRVLVENHRGIAEYGQEKICVKVKMGIVEIRGNDLQVQCISRECLVITGSIHDVALNRRTIP